MAATPLSKFFGEVVRARRKDKAFSQEQVAERAGIHATYVGMVERGERNCSLDIAEAIGKALETPVSKLIAEAESLATNKTGRRKVK